MEEGSKLGLKPIALVTFSNKGKEDTEEARAGAEAQERGNGRQLP